MPSRQQSIGVLLRLCHQRFAASVDTALEKAGFGDIRPHHANIFTFVPPDGIQVSDLTERAGVRKQTMTQAVEELEKLGYLERRQHPTDRRARLVFLTERGKSVRPLAMAAGQEVEEAWSAMLAPGELDAARTTLQHLLAQIGR